MRSTTSAVLFPGALFGEKDYIFRFSMMRELNPENFSNFGAKLGHQKVKKLPKNDLTASFWTHKSSLGRFHFWGENDLQIKKFKMLQKLDRKIFQMRYIGLCLSSNYLFSCFRYVMIYLAIANFSVNIWMCASFYFKSMFCANVSIWFSRSMISAPWWI